MNRMRVFCIAFFALILQPVNATAQARHACSTHPHKWVGSLMPHLVEIHQDIPISFLLGWIEVESGGKLADTTELNERGYFQLFPSESSDLHIDHDRLSTDSVYSLQAGILLVQHYASLAEGLGYSPKDPVFWHIVKFQHAMGAGAVQSLLHEMKNRQADASQWSSIEAFSKKYQADLKKSLKHDPVKWTKNVDEVFSNGNALAKEASDAGCVGSPIS